MSTVDPNSTNSNELPPIIEGLVNRKNGKLFICLEASDVPNKVRVVNPTGDVLLVLEDLFELEPISVARENALESFSQEQLDSMVAWMAQAEEDAVRHAAEAKIAAANALNNPSEQRSGRRIVSKASNEDSESTRKRPRRSTMITNERGPIAAQWASDKLVFYRHRIDPLRPADQFVVRVEGDGVYQMTKAEFQRSFNNVIMSATYRAQGIFRYDQTPPEALAFRRKT